MFFRYSTLAVRLARRRFLPLGLVALGALPFASLAQPSPTVVVSPLTPGNLVPALRAALNAPLPAIVARATGSVGANVPQNELDINAYGLLGSFQPAGATLTATNAFFLPLGTNGRTCATCHQPASAMSISGSAIVARYALTKGADPLFAPVDGANCPNQVPASNTAPSPIGGNKGRGANMLAAHSLILSRGVFRIFLPVPANAEYTLSVVSDPTTCNTDPTYARSIDPGTGAVTQIVSVFRRPRMSSNLAFVTNTLATAGLFPPLDPLTGAPLAIDPSTGLFESGNIMWDGREPTLQSQAIDATMGHAQALTPPTNDQVAQMVAFENGIYSAQLTDYRAGSLTAAGATGGPVYLSQQPPAIPVAFTGGPFMTNFTAWSSITGAGLQASTRESVYRGQQIFNNTTFTITNVAGINDNPNLGPTLVASCGLCHNQQNAGNDSFPAAQHDIGVGGHGKAFGAPAPATDLPIFKLVCNASARPGYNGTTVYTNDPGLALISGKCADIGRTTVPMLRGLAARAPYFHDGSAPTLQSVVTFYNQRFNMGLTAQQQTDLVNFLATL
ncbi:MAG TPA: hypothetical protein VMI92_05820 [Steroidobacteraceae bacterium]|nr:hypothetical protein [Steroidobacteraceae bacterium]